MKFSIKCRLMYRTYTVVIAFITLQASCEISLQPLRLSPTLPSTSPSALQRKVRLRKPVYLFTISFIMFQYFPILHIICCIQCYALHFLVQNRVIKGNWYVIWERALEPINGISAISYGEI